MNARSRRNPPARSSLEPPWHRCSLKPPSPRPSGAMTSLDRITASSVRSVTKSASSRPRRFRQDQDAEAVGVRAGLHVPHLAQRARRLGGNRTVWEPRRHSCEIEGADPATAGRRWRADSLPCGAPGNHGEHFALTTAVIEQFVGPVALHPFFEHAGGMDSRRAYRGAPARAKRPSICLPSITFGPVQPFGETSTIIGHCGRSLNPCARIFF